MTRSIATIGRKVRPRIILALMPLFALLAQGGRLLACGITCQDVVSGCQYRTTDTLLCASNDCLPWPATCWWDHSCDAKRYMNTTTGAYYWTNSTNCGAQVQTEPCGWTYSCSNGSSW